MMNSIKKVIKVVVMILSLVVVPVMIAMILSPNRSFGLYEGHFYELNYWWQTIILLAACNCIFCRITRRNKDAIMLSKMVAMISIIIVIIVALTQSSWGMVKLLDAIGGGNANGIFLLWLPPLMAMILCYGYFAFGRLVAEPIR